MTQTAVEWFFNELQRMQYFIGNDMLEAYNKAKEMEKQQIIDAIDYCKDKYIDSENYYERTFK
jgi:hypothetical protein